MSHRRPQSEFTASPSGEGIAIIGSTGGSVAAAALRESEIVRRNCKLIVTDRQCGLVTVAEDFGIANAVVDGGQDNRRVSDEILRELLQANIGLAISFFTRMFEGGILLEYEGRILNFHLSLLPLHPGRGAFERSIDAGDEFIGSTVHIVDSGMDTGPIILQGRIRNVLSLSVAARRHLVFRSQVHQLIQSFEFGEALIAR